MKPLPSDASDLADNRAGRLSSAQRTAIEREIDRLKTLAPIRLIVIFTGFVAICTIPAVHGDWTKAAIVIGVAFAVIALLALFVTRRAYRRMHEKLADARVETVTSVLESATRGRYSAMYYTRFGGKHMIAARDTIADHQKELEATPHRIYFHPGLERMVSFERA